jgi:site-specific recombinase XerD
MTIAEVSEAYDIWMDRMEYSRYTIKNNSAIKNRIVRYYDTHAISEYSPITTSQFLTEYYAYGKSKGYKHRSMEAVRQIAARLDDYFETGSFVWKQLNHKESHLTECYTDLLAAYANYEKELDKRNPTVVRNVVNILKSLFVYLQNHNCQSIEGLTLKLISDYLTDASRQRPHSVSYNCYVLRLFDKFIAAKEIDCIDISYAIPAIPKRGRKLMPAFSPEEVEALLAAPDRSTPKGKRDFAMIAIAADTGLRSCDIQRLKIDDLDFDGCKINVSQSKTGATTEMPLSPYVGNAIMDYIENARPHTTDVPYIFLRSRRPAVKLSKGGFRASLETYFTPEQRQCGKGTHAFRRYFATSMLQNGTPYDALRDMLGQTQSNTLQSYVRTDSIGLKQCALDFSDIAE